MIGYLLQIPTKVFGIINLNTISKDKQTNMINVWVKNVYTEKGKQEFLKSHKKDKYNKIIKSLCLVSIDYQKKTYNVNRVVYYSKSDIIDSKELSEKKDDFIPKSVGNKLLVKISAPFHASRLFSLEKSDIFLTIIVPIKLQHEWLCGLPPKILIHKLC